MCNVHSHICFRPNKNVEKKPHAKFNNCSKWDTLHFDQSELEPKRSSAPHFYSKVPKSRRTINSSDIWKPTSPSDDGIGGMPVAIPTIISVVATSPPAGNIGRPSWCIEISNCVIYTFLSFKHSQSKTEAVQHREVSHRRRMRNCLMKRTNCVLWSEISCGLQIFWRITTTMSTLGIGSVVSGRHTFQRSGKLLNEIDLEKNIFNKLPIKEECLRHQVFFYTRAPTLS